MKDARVIIEPDSDTENPCDSDQFKVHSFSRRHSNFKDPNELGLGKVGLRRKLEAKTAFILSYFEHGDCVWSLEGEGPSCPWDSVRVAGLLVWEGKPNDIGKTPAQREAAARSFIENYTDWCNGRCYHWRVETLDGKEVNSCSGVIGWDWLVRMIQDECPDVRIVEAEGEASDGFPVEEAEEAEV
jgi:hypothetical protein